MPGATIRESERSIFRPAISVLTFTAFEAQSTGWINVGGLVLDGHLMIRSSALLLGDQTIDMSFYSSGDKLTLENVFDFPIIPTGSRFRAHVLVDSEVPFGPWIQMQGAVLGTTPTPNLTLSLDVALILG